MVAGSACATAPAAARSCASPCRPAPRTPTAESAEVLIVDDDEPFRRILSRALRHRGFDVHAVATGAAALDRVQRLTPQGIVLDLRLAETASGLDLLPELRRRCPDARLLMLTGYASIATAVEAVKAGADEYLAKPADADTILHHLRLTAAAPAAVAQAQERMSLRRLEWEHIQQVLQQHDGNISAAARALGMHRRTLQRKLQKRSSGL